MKAVQKKYLKEFRNPDAQKAIIERTPAAILDGIRKKIIKLSRKNSLQESLKESQKKRKNSVNHEPRIPERITIGLPWEFAEEIVEQNV